ncbi:MAG TPA: tetratricopeptide repeat protein, partial [Blastocatellia bacterium]|nr:tetratricopeptide repeat protein [Blastocatellia bacterium]
MVFTQSTPFKLFRGFALPVSRQRVTTAGLAASLALAFLCQAALAGHRGGQTRTQAVARRGTAPTFAELSKRADAARLSGRLEEAIGLYFQALKMRPSFDDGWWYLGTLLYDRDRYEPARDAFKVLVSHLPDRGSAYAMLGLCEFQTREYENALAHLEEGRKFGLAANEDLIAVARYHVGILLTRFERYDDGREALAGLARRPETPSLIEAFGLNALRMPILPSEIQPDQRELVLAAGRAAYHAAGLRSTDAKAALDRLIAAYPKTPWVHYLYGTFLLSEKPDQALEEFRHELEISPNNFMADLQIAFEYLKRTDYKAAQPFAEKALSLAPESPAPHDMLGKILVEDGDLDRGIGELELAAKIAPNSA